MESKQVTQEELKKVFEGFDKDKNGYIDIKEVSLAAKELGVEISEDEVKKIFNEIDKNHDGRISFPEFTSWWNVSQKKDANPKFNLFKLKAMNFAKKFKSSKSFDVSSESEVGVDHSEFILKLGDADVLGTKVDARVWVGATAEEQFKAFCSGMEFDNTNHGVVFKIHSNNAENAKSGLQELIDNVIELVGATLPGADMFTSAINIKYHHDDEQIYVGVQPNDTVPFLGDFLQMSEFFFNTAYPANYQVTLSGEVGIKHSLLELLQKAQNNSGLISDILSGVSAQFHIQVPSTLNKELSKFYLAPCEENLECVPKKLRRLILLTLLKQFKIHLNLNSIPKDAGIPIPEFGSLVDLLTQLKEMQISEMVNSIPPVSQAVEFTKENLKTNFSIGIKFSRIFVSLHFRTNGVKEVFDFVVAE